MIKLSVGGILAIAFALAIVTMVAAQQPEIRITDLDCSSDPELVVIENQGDAPQQLAGWKLLSDPSQTEVFELAALGGLEPDASVFIQSGPSAAGAFQWGNEFVFRDDDPTDYVRLVDDTGAVVDEISCAGSGTEPSPTPSPQPSPTPSPEASPPGDVPNGGGPPPVSGGNLSLVMMMVLGGSVAAAGLITISLPWLRLGGSVVAASSQSPGRSAAVRLAAQRVGQGGSRPSMASAVADMALLGLVAAVALLLLGRRRA